jgi:hypothetical protein
MYYTAENHSKEIMLKERFRKAEAHFHSCHKKIKSFQKKNFISHTHTYTHRIDNQDEEYQLEDSKFVFCFFFIKY